MMVLMRPAHAAFARHLRRVNHIKLRLSGNEAIPGAAVGSLDQISSFEWGV